MGMQMNIKNEEAYAIASELAGLEGVTLTQAVLDALRARKRELTKADKLERVMALCRDTAARLSPETLAIDHGELLYDELGLPK
jgi:antitoxin VapB